MDERQPERVNFPETRWSMVSAIRRRAEDGPRAELVLSVSGPQDSVLRRLAVLAASPAVEGVVLVPGAGLRAPGR